MTMADEQMENRKVLENPVMPDDSSEQEQRSGDPPVQEQTTNQTSEPKKPSSKVKIIVTVVIIACVALVVAFFATADLRAYHSAEKAYRAGNYEEAQKTFSSLGDYKDSKDMVTKCIYALAVEQYNSKQYDDALENFNQIQDYKDAADYANKCTYQLGVSQYESGDYQRALDNFKSLGDYEDAKDYVEKCEFELSTDGKFIRALSEGLQKRWAYSDENEDMVSEDELYKEATSLELESVESFENETFNDSTLGDDAREYISQLNAGLKAVTYYLNDYTTFLTQWQDAYNERTILIKTFVDNYGLSVDEKYQDYLDNLTSNAGAVLSAREDEESLSSDLQKTIDSIQFGTTNTGDSEYPFYDSFITVTNQTQKTFSYFYFDVNVKDTSGNIIETVQTDDAPGNWAPGSQITLEVYFYDSDKDYSGYTLEYVPHYQTTDGLSNEF